MVRAQVKAEYEKGDGLGGSESAMSLHSEHWGNELGSSRQTPAARLKFTYEESKDKGWEDEAGAKGDGHDWRS